ncbi:CDP-diacylglycerol-inositol 3-phosphatidyltransferase [Coccomyxa sp. Obi]|nr:CDP-diacylglycerol-inositol 3-phosphatidyltransferase [Coccomyxa sp. Obi]
MARHWFLTRHQNQYLYVPNLIGYARILSALIAFAVALRSPTLCVAFYFFGFVCDELDGRFARMLNQATMLGQVLDMVTDRLSTAGLLAILGMLSPRWYFGFLALLMLDIFSHWFQMYATMASGATTHKATDSRSAVVRFYYRQRLFMGFCCVCCEVLYLSLYLLHFKSYQRWPLVPVPLLGALQPHLNGAAAELEGVPLALVIALLAVPGFVIKQFINCVQLRSAMQLLVATDQNQDSQSKQKTKQALDALAKMQ